MRGNGVDGLDSPEQDGTVGFDRRSNIPREVNQSRGIKGVIMGELEEDGIKELQGEASGTLQDVYTVADSLIHPTASVGLYLLVENFAFILQKEIICFVTSCNQLIPRKKSS